MNRLKSRQSSSPAVHPTGGGGDGNFQKPKGIAKPQQHSASVTIKVNHCEPLSPVCLKIRADPSTRKCEPDIKLLGYSLGNGKVLSSSLESLVNLPNESVPLHATKWGQHLGFPCNGGNLLQSKALSSSQILSPANRGDEVDITTVSPLKPSHLAKLIQDGPLQALLLDCRTFVCYNSNHIEGALNVSCADAISRKRLLCRRTTLGELVSGPPDAKELYKQAVEDEWEFLVYDDNTADIKALNATHPLKVVVSCLQKAGHLVSYVLGGLQAFYKNYSHLCSQPTSPPSRPLPCNPSTPLDDSDVDSAKISQILPHLYLGNERDAADGDLLQELGITHVLNVTSHIPFHFEMRQLKFKRLPATDSGNQNLKQYFREAIHFIDEAERRGGRVLIHCQAGVSRSSTIAIAYVMVRLSMTMLDAFHFVKSKRSIVAPNFNFMGQLLDFEGMLSREASEQRK